MVLNQSNNKITKLLKSTMKFSNFNLNFVMNLALCVMEIYVFHVMIISIITVTKHKTCRFIN